LAAPFVILGRIRRTTPIWLLLMDALVIYGTFLALAWQMERSLVTSEGGLLHLAIPAGLTLLAVLLENAYLAPHRKPTFPGLIQSVVIALGAGALSWSAGLLTDVNLYGFLMSQMMVSTARLMFDPEARAPQGVVGPPVPAGRGLPSATRTARVALALILLGVICWLWWHILGRKVGHP